MRIRATSGGAPSSGRAASRASTTGASSGCSRSASGSPHTSSWHNPNQRSPAAESHWTRNPSSSTTIRSRPPETNVRKYASRAASRPAHRRLSVVEINSRVTNDGITASPSSTSVGVKPSTNTRWPAAATVATTAGAVTRGQADGAPAGSAGSPAATRAIPAAVSSAPPTSSGVAVSSAASGAR